MAKTVELKTIKLVYRSGTYPISRFIALSDLRQEMINAKAAARPTKAFFGSRQVGACKANHEKKFHYYYILDAKA